GKITPHSYLSSSRVTLPSLNLHTSVLSFLCRLPALPVSPWLSGFPALHMRPVLTAFSFRSVLPVLISFLPLPRLFLLSLAHAVLLKHFRHTGRYLIRCVTGLRQLRPHFVRLHPLKEIGSVAEVICLRIDPILFTEQVRRTVGMESVLIPVILRISVRKPGKRQFRRQALEDFLCVHPFPYIDTVFFRFKDCTFILRHLIRFCR